MEEYSYSRLTRFIDCPLSYMRKYLNAEVPESHGITEGGLFMHNLLEMYERGKIDKDGMIDYFKKNYEKEVTSTCNLQMSENFSKDMYYLYYNGYLNYLENFNGIEDCKKIVDVEISHRERIAGTSNYSLRKLFRLWIQGMTNFSIVPLRLSSIIGMLSAVLGFIYGIVLIIQKLINPNVFLGYTSLMAVILVIGGLLMIMVGILGEYVGRIYILLSNMPQYNIREVISQEQIFKDY